ncbi:hypothetical protein BKA69DRAFT_1088067 [Paraphysoderma sedebokerense]|nr:hypothetical protein BKA69DRAFT_1087928 [Paraphysoderma sedebokerense]KAI9139054.1 hypothetical protein BKA69DRAFT_1088067 [Paraphysoderma sedebokerense]
MQIPLKFRSSSAQVQRRHILSTFIQTFIFLTLLHSIVIKVEAQVADSSKAPSLTVPQNPAFPFNPAAPSLPPKTSSSSSIINLVHTTVQIEALLPTAVTDLLGKTQKNSNSGISSGPAGSLTSDFNPVADKINEETATKKGGLLNSDIVIPIAVIAGIIVLATVGFMLVRTAKRPRGDISKKTLNEGNQYNAHPSDIEKGGKKTDAKTIKSDKKRLTMYPSKHSKNRKLSMISIETIRESLNDKNETSVTPDLEDVELADSVRSSKWNFLHNMAVSELVDIDGEIRHSFRFKRLEHIESPRQSMASVKHVDSGRISRRSQLMSMYYNRESVVQHAVPRHSE